MLPVELQKLFGGCDEDDYNLRITKVENKERPFKISVTIDFLNSDDSGAIQDWMVEAAGYATHSRIFGQYKNFHMFSVEESPHFKPFRYTNGLLTQGSEQLLLQYADCLQKQGMGYSILGGKPPVYWDGKQYLPELPGLKVLLFGKSYIIAQEFSFYRESENFFHQE